MPDQFCPSCGSGARASDAYCRRCGFALNDDARAAGPMVEAELLVARGQLDEAIATIQRALGVADAPDLRVALATLYLHRGDITDAARELDRAIAIDPACAVAHAYSGALRLRQGRIGEAEDALDRARDLAPNDLLVSLKRAEYFCALGVLERARDELKHGLTYGGGSDDARIGAAKLLADIERKLSRSVRRHPVALPRLGAAARVFRRGGHSGNRMPAEGEA